MWREEVIRFCQNVCDSVLGSINQFIGIASRQGQRDIVHICTPVIRFSEVCHASRGEQLVNRENRRPDRSASLA